MSSTDRIIVNRYHEMAIRAHGASSVGALGWLDSESQLSRFEMLAGIGDMNNRSVLDAGCGHGDLFAFLSEKYRLGQYTGIDHSETFVITAIKKYGKHPQVCFQLADFDTDELPEADYVLLSGSLNYRNSDPGFIYKMIAKLFAACKIAMGFNLLNDVYDPIGILVAYNMEAINDYCRTLTGNTILHKDYTQGDFTIWMYK